MNNAAFFYDVNPGPACTIPEDKKIFRVTPAYPTRASHELPEAWIADPSAAAEGSVEGLQLPVPHMYSA